MELEPGDATVGAGYEERAGKSKSYWKREQSALGRLVNDVTDRVDNALTAFGGLLAGQLSSALHANRDLAAMKTEWRAPGPTFGGLETPQSQTEAEPTWNATTGTFEKPARVAELTTDQFAEMIAERLGESNLDLDGVTKALTMLDNAAVYLHGADPANRSDRSPTAIAIADEWVDLRISQKEAAFMIERTIETTENQQEGDRQSEYHTWGNLAVDLDRKEQEARDQEEIEL